MSVFSPRLLTRYQELLEGEDYAAFLRVSKTKWPKTLRVNGIKATPAWVESRLKEREISFSVHSSMSETFFLANVSQLVGGMWETQQGFWQPQELASQLPSRVLNPEPGQMVLDMAAAPGNKTIQLAEAMQNTGSILACENAKHRKHSRVRAE